MNNLTQTNTHLLNKIVSYLISNNINELKLSKFKTHENKAKIILPATTDTTKTNITFKLINLFHLIFSCSNSLHVEIMHYAAAVQIEINTLLPAPPPCAYEIYI